MKNKIDLNAPAFGKGAQKVEETVEETVVEPTIEKIEEPKIEPIEPSEEESKVPYSRFKKFHQEAREAREEAEKWRLEAERLKNQPEPTKYSDELPPQWAKLYGDSDASKDAWKVQQDLNRQIREDALKEAREAVRNERYEEAQRIEDNVGQIDSSFEDLSAFIGRDLTEKEQSALLDIVDEFTPKDRYGNYAGETTSLEKAWEVYELKNNISKAPKTQARDTVAALTGKLSQGGTTAEVEERNKNWNPLNWNGYKDRL